MLVLMLLVPLPSGDLSAVERWAVFAAAVAAGMVALGAITRRVVSAFRRCRSWVREGIRRADALDKLVQHELHPNSGGSLHDAVHRLDDRMTAVEGSLSTMAESQTHMWPAIEAVARSRPADDKEN